LSISITAVVFAILFAGLLIRQFGWPAHADRFAADPAEPIEQEHIRLATATMVRHPQSTQADSASHLSRDESSTNANILPESPAASDTDESRTGTQPVLANRIDELVFQQLEELELAPAALSTDSVFLRRAYLDVIGTLPTAEEAAAFLDDTDSDKRALLIDHLLERPEFADYWAMKWCDVLRVKAEFPINLWPNAAQAYHRWIRTAIADNLPYDQFARELLTASGSNFRTPQVNFYRAVQGQEPATLSQAAVLTFLCQRTDHWTPELKDGVTQFFHQVGFKPTGEWKEEIVYFDPRLGPGGPERQPATAMFPDGTTTETPRGTDPRIVFANWLVDPQNDMFARAVCNRVWCWLYGRGIIEPSDDIRPDSIPVNPELLDYLAEELVASGYDLRHLYRLILNSSTWQLSCDADAATLQHLGAYPVRRLDAEVLIDAICQVTGTTESYSSIIPEPYTFLPNDQRAIALPDGSITSSFLEMFGRPPRDTGWMSERNNRFTAGQALHLLNSNHIRNKLKRGAGLASVSKRGFTSLEIADRLYLTILSRRPTEEELQEVLGYCAAPNGVRDFAWVLLNSDEFLFRH